MKRLGFNQVVWVAALAVVAYLLALPPVMDLWAHARWTEVPCFIGSGGRYFYEFKPPDESTDAKYQGSRQNFWDLSYTAERATQDTDALTQTATCWVNPHDPLDSVLRLDAHSNWSGALGRSFVAGLLLVTVVGVVHFGLRKRA